MGCDHIKKLIKCLIAALFVGLSMIFFSGIASASTLSANGRINGPTSGAIIQGTVKVWGWFLDGSGVSKIEMYIDGALQGKATYGISRPDVYKVYPQYKNNNSGYQYSLDARKFKNGNHTLMVKETGTNGMTLSKSETVNVQNLPAKGSINGPTNGSTIQGTTKVWGWFLDGSGVSKVQVYVDGQYKGTAAYGIYRPDVYKVYPQYKNNYSGYQYPLDTRNLRTGTHTLTIKETGTNGATLTRSETVSVQNLPAIGTIDGPKSGATLYGKTKVWGWFLNGSGVNKVEVYVDDEDQGTATYGISRPDVEKVYPKYNNSNSGYQFTLKDYELGVGSHTLKVVETGANGEQKSVSRTIQIIHEGIDVSNNNGSVDFQALKNSGLSFVITKASEGTNIEDSTFKNNLAGAQSVGLGVGAYHYLDSPGNVTNAKSEADHFASVLKSANFNGYAFLDVETLDKGESSATLTNVVSAFLNELRADGITKIGIYSYLNFYDTNLSLSSIKNAFPDLLIWTAAWHSADVGPGFSTDLWQYTDTGNIIGVIGNVDMDLSFNPLF
jgi:Lyzozyme M1 (1,4-beta-N-acetylmuramidase)